MGAPKAERNGASLPRIRSAYDGSRVAVRLICVEGEDRTQQQFKDECDINVLMKRYEKTGILPTGNDAPPVYLDVADLDYTASMNQIALVRGVFSQLDARTRARFENNPEVMIDFLGDPANHREAVVLGLLPKEILNGRSQGESGAGRVGQAGEADSGDGAAGRGAAASGGGKAASAALGEAGGNAGEAVKA